MFKHKDKFNQFVKRQIAMFLAIVMALSCVVSTGMTMQTAEAQVTGDGDGGSAFVADLVEIARLGTPYVWGGWGPVGPNGGVDCRGYVRRALERVYGLDIFETVGYLCDEDGNPVDGNGNKTNNKVYVDVAAYDAQNTWHKYVGMRVCVEGNGHKTYYRVLCADKLYNLDNVLDTPYNGSLYSSIIAWACQYPGTIISHNGHYGVGIGAFDSEAELLATYPGLAGAASGTAGGMKIRWLSGAYNLGNNYTEPNVDYEFTDGYPDFDTRHWFGKTVFLSACSTKSGIRADNFTTTGKNAAPSTSSDLTILLCEQPVKEVNVTIKKVDADNLMMSVSGAKYGIYRDAACTSLVKEFTTEKNGNTFTLDKGKYYVKEISAPKNGSNKYTYQKSDQIYYLDATSDVELTLKDNPVNATVFVQKVDVNDTSISLSRTQFKIQEYNSKTQSWNDLVDLKYDQVRQGFTILTSYRNNEGTSYSDGSLHYSQTNQGDFKLVEVKAQSGYANDGYVKTFNITNGPLLLTGKNAITNQAMLSLKIVKVTPDGEPLQGAKMQFEYNGQIYQGETDEDGILVFENIPEAPKSSGRVLTGKLYEARAPLGYIPTTEYLLGRDITLTKNQVVNGCYQTVAKVVNGSAEKPPVEVTQGDILMKKVDLSDALNLMSSGVPNTYYTLYTDEALTKVAENIHGVKYNRVKTNANGEFLFEDLPVGLYYLREVEPPTGYAIQPVTFAISLLPDYADAAGNLIVRAPDNVGDLRQFVELNLTKTDSASSKPVPGAVYALQATSDLSAAMQPQTIFAGTLIGYYMTDENGNIKVTKMGSAAFSVGEQGTSSYKEFPAVNPVGDKSYVATGEGLVNGTYSFVEVYAPEGYTLNGTKYNVDASYVMNNSSESITTNSGATVLADGRWLIPATVNAKDTRQSIVINLTKTDSVKGSAKDNYPYLTNQDAYNEAVLARDVATLSGAVYQLVNTEDIYDIDSGELIIAGNILGTYQTNANGKVTIDKFNLGKYANHAIPTGSYELVEIASSLGYAINETPITIECEHDYDSTTQTITKNVSHKEDILKQKIVIKKIDSASKEPLAGAQFNIYDATEFYTAIGGDTNSLPWATDVEYNADMRPIDAEVFLALAKNKITPVGGKTYTTGADGTVTTDELIFGNYVVVETGTPDGYNGQKAYFVQIPSNVELVVEEMVVVHEMMYQPDGDFEMVVTNDKIEEFKFMLRIIKIDSETGDRIVTDSAKFELYDSASNKIVQSDKGNPWATDANGEFVLLEKLPAGTYTLKEIEAPDGYEAIGDVTIVVAEESASARQNAARIRCDYLDDETYGTLINVYVPNEKLPEPVPTVNITVNKQWDAPEGTTLPNDVEVFLLANGQQVNGSYALLNANGNWTHTWSDMPEVDANGNEIAYTVEELTVDGYTTTIGTPVKNAGTIAITITNTFIPVEPEEPEEPEDPIPEFVSVKVNKIWDVPAGVSTPDAVNVYLLANGVKVDGTNINLTAVYGWSHTWHNLPKNDDSGAAIQYTVAEKALANYNTSYELVSDDGDAIEYNVKNEYIVITPEATLVDVEVKKEWVAPAEATLPESVNVVLMANGQLVAGSSATLNAANGWTHTWEDMPEKDINGVDFTYQVQEVSVDGFTTVISAPVKTEGKISFVVTNTYIAPPPVPEVLDIIVKKDWVVPDGVTIPESVEVYLMANGQVVDGSSVTLNAGNSWTHTWTSVPKHDQNGTEITYSVNEVAVDGYITTNHAPIVGSGVIQFNIQNEYVVIPEPEMVEITVNKVWNAPDGLELPASVEVILKAGDTVVAGSRVVLNAENNWTHTWTDMPKHDANDNEIVYGVQEVTVDGYTTTISAPTVDGDKIGFVITNNYIIPEPDPIVTHVIVSKYEIIGQSKKAVAGSVLQILDSEKNLVVLPNGTVCEWTTTNDNTIVDEYGVAGHLIDGLSAGTYYLHEKSAPAGYATSDDVQFTVTETEEIQYAHMIESPITLHVNKVDAENNDLHVSGAQLTLIDANENVIDSWTTDGSTHVISHIPVGEYIIRELVAPEGYLKADDIRVVITDTAVAHKAVVENERVFGTLEIIKTDKDTHKPLKGVEFELISVNKVIDPVSGNVIYQAGEVIETLVTDDNGVAVLSKNIPIATYGQDGIEYIKYQLVETKTAGGQYAPLEGPCDVEFVYKDDKTPVVKLDFNLTNNHPNIVVNKTGTPDTFVGAVADKNNVTVLKDGDQITYTITVQNTGSASAWNVVVRDKIPANTTFVSIANDSVVGTYDQATNTVYWDIDELKAGNSVELKFIVSVNSDKACEIINIAQYAMSETIPAKPEEKILPTDDNNDWINTEAVIHQTVEFHKTSEVPGGKDASDATDVAVGDTITYKMSFIAVDDVYDIVVTDKVPNGLKFVSGSARINGVSDTTATYNPDTRVVTFSAVDANNETVVFEFDVIVEDIKYGAEKVFINIAEATHAKRDGSDATDTLTSEVVSHYTNKDVEVEKHGTPTTFEGDAAQAHDATVLKSGESITYSIIAKNTGLSAIKDFVITDVVPTGTKFVEVKEIEGVKSWYDEETGLVTWYIDELGKDETVTVEFVVKVEKQEAQLIINQAHYGNSTPDGEDAPVLPEDSAKTNDVVHQVIEFHKSSVVEGGKDAADATQVAIGDTIVYTLELIAKNDLHGVNIRDAIPAGLSYIEGSLQAKEVNEDEWTKLDEKEWVFVDETGYFITSPDLTLEPGRYYFQFSVKVDKIGMNNEKFYVNQAFVDYTINPNDPDSKEAVLESETVSHMTFTKIEGVKTGKVETYVGDYESRQNVTVVVDGEEITYTISVANLGASKFDTLIIKDVVPAFTTFVSAENDGQYDKETNTVIWTLHDVASGDTATVQFKVKVDCGNKAEEIRNKAQYVVPNDENNIKDDEWMTTDEVIHQTVELHKTSSIAHGKTEADAPLVAIGSKFTYTITFTNKNDVYGLTIKDVLPKGLTFVVDSARYTLQGGEEVKVNDLVVGEDRTLTFPTIATVPAGTATFSFDVTVNDVAEFDREYYFINKAEATVKTNKDSEKVAELESETISHQTIKTNETDTPKLGFEATSETAMWAMIALTSAIAMIGCVLYVVTGKKKRK